MFMFYCIAMSPPEAYIQIRPDVSDFLGKTNATNGV